MCNYDSAQGRVIKGLCIYLFFSGGCELYDVSNSRYDPYMRIVRINDSYVVGFERVEWIQFIIILYKEQ